MTANRRAETVLEAPLSITAVSAEALQEKAATSFFDYASAVPNLSFGNTSYGVNSRTIALRGIAGGGTTGLYIDETPVPESLDPKIFDVERIEVLRGPQGTLYGARSMGGTVRLITVQPSTSEVSGRLHASVSDTAYAPKPNFQVDGAYNIPLSDTLALRVSGIREYTAGYFERAYPDANGGLTTVDGVGALTTSGLSVAALFKPSDSLSITPRLIYQKNSYKGFPFGDVAVPDPLAPVPLVPSSLTNLREFDIPESAKDKFLLASAEIRLERAFGTFTSATSYFDRTASNVEDNSLALSGALGLPIARAVIANDEDGKQFTQEFRFSSDFEGPFQLVAGLYYNHTKGFEVFPPTVVAELAEFGLDTNVYSGQFRDSSKEYAAYAEGTLNVTQRLSLTAGARLFETKTEAQTTTDGLAVGGLQVGPVRKHKENGINPKFSAKYELTDSAQVYATAAKGYRPGGSQAPLTAPSCAADLARLGITPEDTATFKSDSVWSYEVGAKGRAFDNRVSAAAAVFRIDWSDIPQTITLPCGFLFRDNAGKARSQGVELEFDAHPVDGLSLGLGFGYTDAKITKTLEGGSLRAGDRIQQVPRYTLTASAGYDWPVTERIEGFVNADYKYVSNSISTVNSIRDPATGSLAPRFRPSYDIVGARAGVRFDNVELAVFGKNLTNEIASLSDVVSLGAEAPGRARVSINQPRTIGVEARLTF
ncbi:TonB-dependent receptor [Phenylobacterium sp.]|uniref:TonB-dependent receptor n=1 Tax=Phenylobacterium sp. TaxID=1871053 RepID=UPI0037846007